jgi:hypothetical protein
MKATTLFRFFLCGLGPCMAHVGKSAASTANATVGASLAAQSAALQSCITAFSQGNDAQGIAAAGKAISVASGSPIYECQLGGQLAQAALLLADLGNAAAARRAADVALTHLDITGAVLSTGRPGVLALADEAAGLLQERIYHNLIAAQRCYARAVQREPGRATAKAGLRRLNAILVPIGN